MPGVGRTYVGARAIGIVALVSIALIAGISRSLFGDGSVHVVDDGPVTLFVDGASQPIVLASPRHWTAEIPRGKHEVRVVTPRDERKFQLDDVGGHSVLLLPMSGQCFTWYAYVPVGGRMLQLKVFKRVQASEVALDIPDTALFETEAQPERMNAGSAVFTEQDCDAQAAATDAQLLDPARRLQIVCATAACASGEQRWAGIRASPGEYMALVLWTDAGAQVLVSGEAGSRQGDREQPISGTTGTTARLYAVFASAPITPDLALRSIGASGPSGGSGGSVSADFEFEIVRF